MTGLDTDAVLEEFRQAGALLEGHFILSSGRHSPVFLQKALLFADPLRTERLCTALGKAVQAKGWAPDIIVSPAVGAIIPGYETARVMGLNALYVEREDGVFRLRRGFSLKPGMKVLVVEDIVTTGLSSRECIDAVREAGGHVIGLACLVDRSAGSADPGVDMIALARVNFPDYPPEAVPEALAALPAIKPGSRGLV